MDLLGYTVLLWVNERYACLISYSPMVKLDSLNSLVATAFEFDSLARADIRGSSFAFGEFYKLEMPAVAGLFWPSSN